MLSSPLAETEMPLEIFAYDPAYATDFRRLNEAWIKQYFGMEETDRRSLADPEAYFIQPGGMIFFARLGGRIVGTLAMLPIREDAIELCKMGVEPGHQGKGIGKRLIAAAIDFARNVGAKSIEIQSNRSLEAAMALYKRCGFVEVGDGKDSPYERCNIELKLVL